MICWGLSVQLISIHRTTIHTMHDKEGTSVIAIVPR